MTLPVFMQEINQLIEIILRTAEQYYQQQLLSCYLLGSLAHGGFSPSSDIDIALIFKNNSESSAKKLETLIKEKQFPHHERLSFFWCNEDALHAGTLTQYFPLIDRIDLLDHGKLVYGPDVRNAIPRPTVLDVLTDCAHLVEKIIIEKDIKRYLHHPALLASQNPTFVTKIILYPVRVLAGLAEGNVTTVASAVKYYLTRNELNPSKQIVELAYLWRTKPCEDLAAYLPLITKNLPLLYQQCLNAFISRLNDLKQHHLAQRLDALSHFLMLTRSEIKM